MTRFSIFLFAVAAIQLSCKNASQDSKYVSPSLGGVWAYIENDTLYGEVIFTSDHFWEYTEYAGVTYRPYNIKSDTVQLLDLNGRPFIRTKYIRVSEDEFVLERERMRVHYNRLTVPIDTSKLLSGEEKALDDYVFNGLMIRKYEWESKRKK